MTFRELCELGIFLVQQVHGREIRRNKIKLFLLTETTLFIYLTLFYYLQTQ